MGGALGKLMVPRLCAPGPWVHDAKMKAVDQRSPANLAPLAGVLAYPFLLQVFHAAIGPKGSMASVPALGVATLALAVAFAVPAVGLFVANRAVSTAAPLRRLAFLCVAAPTLYVFLGVVNYMAASAYPDELLWVVLWAAIGAWAFLARHREAQRPAPDVARGRIAHGTVAVLAAAFILFHVLNHLFFLDGPAAHSSVRLLGEEVYRARTVEFILVLLLLFMCCSGGYLAWRWSESDTRHDFFRTFQVASGVYLLFYLVGHMDSVFVYARLYLGIETDWKFAVGAPAGLIHDAWNIRLLPHYLLGVFFALTHPLTGLRGILVKHGLREAVANGAWAAGAAVSAVVAAAIGVGMAGVR